MKLFEKSDEYDEECFLKNILPCLCMWCKHEFSEECGIEKGGCEISQKAARLLMKVMEITG